jgi:hypothetical protein
MQQYNPYRLVISNTGLLSPTTDNRKKATKKNRSIPNGQTSRIIGLQGTKFARAVQYFEAPASLKAPYETAELIK